MKRGLIKMLENFGDIPHVLFGVLGILASVWVLVELLNLNEGNLKRLKLLSIYTSIFIWLSYLLGGWWYKVYYGVEDIGDKFIIKAGPFPEAHTFFMEAKEHIFFILLLLSTLLPIIVHNKNLVADKNIKKLTLTVTIIILILGLGMEGFGSLIAKGVKMGLLGG